MSEITVCIPTYEYKGDGVAYLGDLFDSLARQTFENFDVVISDHSKDDVIMEWCRHCHYDFEITYKKTPMDVDIKHPTPTVPLKMQRVES